MQEQQQQQLKAMLGPRGQLAYYGLRLPQQQQSANSSGLTRGPCPPYRSLVTPALHSARPALVLPTYETASSTVSSFIESVNEISSVYPSSTTPSTPLTTTTTSASSASDLPSLKSFTLATSSANSVSGTAYNGVTDTPNTTANITSSSIVNTTANSVSSISSSVATISSTDTSKVNNVRKNIGNNMVNSISSSTPNGSDSGKSESKIAGRGQDRRTPPPPSRMVTRSQTAAVRTPVSVDGEDRQSVRGKSKRSRSCSEKDGQSPRKIRPELGINSGIGFDDFPSKNPSGSGIEFGAVCSDCGAVAVTGTGWNAHQAAHRGDGAPCSHCTLVFLTTHGRDAHQQLHREGHTRDVDDYCECGLCGGSFIGVMYLELHLLELHGRDALYDQRALHLGPSNNNDNSCPQEDESGRQLFRCGVCHTQFTYSLNLDCHMALHTEVSYACALCDTAFQSLDPLVNHSRAHRFAGIPPSSVTSVPVHLAGAQVPLRRHTGSQRSGVPATSPTPFSMWGLQQVRNNQHSVVAQPTCPTTPMGVPLNSSLTPPMSPAMLNYYMMMSLWGGEKTNAAFDTPMWTNYLNPAMSNVFNYINPYLLNNNSNGVRSKSEDIKNDESGKVEAEEVKEDSSIEAPAT
ncbi:uncharacterized protein [Procambarus clarkii]|uniref:uncharacterized protein n=1 Tax=Procambarus clarkii TaxID=6728 RepID=UPI001E6713F8|nr:zinc finger protein 384-like [Procambarus clarkii]XP_045595662.1 zinc finger protein 384-like [Procambarus clarkii]